MDVIDEDGYFWIFVSWSRGIEIRIRYSVPGEPKNDETWLKFWRAVSLVWPVGGITEQAKYALECAGFQVRATQATADGRSKMRFIVTIADLDKKPHNRCFEDFAKAFSAALRDLGHDVRETQFWTPFSISGARLVVFGANDAASTAPYPADAIFYNAEQVAIFENPLQLIPPSTPDRIIWDYSQANVAKWRALGFKNVLHCPVGYHPSMRTQAANTLGNQDVDVLHYGFMTPRRQEVLKALQRSGLVLMALNGVYGEERDAWIARSKIVLNIHHTSRSLFEIFRCSHLFANHKCVVTESGSEDPELEELARHTCVHAPLEELVQQCRLMVDGTEGTPGNYLRSLRSQRAFEVFEKISLTENVRRAVESL